eukprot:scaffold38535_cov33-Attheya_sp.AAC.1
MSEHLLPTPSVDICWVERTRDRRTGIGRDNFQQIMRARGGCERRLERSLSQPHSPQCKRLRLEPNPLLAPAPTDQVHERPRQDLDLTEDITPVGVTPRTGPRSLSPGTSPSLFSTSSSAMSGWFKNGRRCDSKFNQWMILLAVDCSTQSPRAGQVWLKPSLLIHQLPTEVSVEELVAMQKPFQVMSALFARITAELNEGKLKVGASSNISLPGSWTPIDLDQVELLEEANRMMKSPTKLKLGPFLAKMAATVPMGGPKMEPSVKIPLDGTGKGKK